MSDILNIIHLRKELFPVDSIEYKESLFREENIKKQVQENNVQDYKVWDGIIVQQIPFMGINLSFKMIVKDAKLRGLKSVVLAEDDFSFTCPTSWERFLETEPEDYDSFHSCIFDSKIDDSNKIEFGFCGMTLLRIHERFYDTFLALKVENNIDREMGRFANKYKFIVADPFVCIQLGGYSFHQRKTIENYDHLIVGRNLYRG